MCRSAAQGGRRCSGSHSGSSTAGHAGDSAWADDDSGQESYQGTPWQGYDEYMQRSAELERRIDAGESITDIMREEHMKRMEERIEQITREGW